MSRIIKINTTSVIIGNDDLSTTEARLSDCNFTPVIGDEVDVFKTENEVIVSKKSKPVVQGINPEGIVINVANNQNSNNQVLNYNASTDVHVVNKGWFLFWAFFLGGIGAHRFYAGYPLSGTLYFLFSWTFIPAFFAFLEFMVACFKRADANGNILV